MEYNRSIMYHVVKLDNKIKSNEIIFSNKNLFEARQYLENYAFDFIVGKNGDRAMKLNDTKYSSNNKTDAKCDFKVQIPVCLHRMHNKNSLFWKNLDMDYIITRNPISDSIYELTIYYRKLITGLIYNDCIVDKVFSLDIVIEKRNKNILLLANPMISWLFQRITIQFLLNSNKKSNYSSMNKL